MGLICPRVDEHEFIYMDDLEEWVVNPFWGDNRGTSTSAPPHH